jgi:hypothetical protein
MAIAGLLLCCLALTIALLVGILYLYELRYGVAPWQPVGEPLKEIIDEPF